MELNLITIIVLALVFSAGVFVGVLLGRRSKGANETVDAIRQKWYAETAELRAQIKRMQDKSGS